MNKIIKRIAAYYQADNSINTTIEQSISNNYFNSRIQPRQLIHNLNSNITNAITLLKYGVLDIGLCGDTFMLKNNDQITIEWQVKHIINESIYAAKEKISEQYPLNNFSSLQKQKDVNELLVYINDNYYLCVLLIFCNNNCINSDPSKPFSRSYSIQRLKNIGERFIQQKKLKFLANDH